MTKYILYGVRAAGLDQISEGSQQLGKCSILFVYQSLGARPYFCQSRLEVFLDCSLPSLTIKIAVNTNGCVMEIRQDTQ